MTTQLREVTAASLSEAAVTDGGTVRLRIIGPGWSQNGRYYPPETLQAAARDRVFAAGTHSYIDHPTATEEADRPERSLRDLAGSLATDAVWEEAGPHGPGLYADATIRDAYRPLVDDLAEVIGPSIRAEGMAQHGEAEGREGPIVSQITSAESVDLVTRPAAGGRVVQLIESVRSGHQLVPLEEARNAGAWLEAFLHATFTERADHLYGEGFLTRDERIALSQAIGQALTAFNDAVGDTAPHLYQRDPFADPDPSPTQVSESESPGEPGGSTMPEIPEEELAALREAASRVPDLERQLEEANQGSGERPSTSREVIQRELEQERHARAVVEARERARDVIAGVLEEAWVGPTVRQRITESLLANLPMTENRQLDEQRLVQVAESQRDQAEREASEIMSAGGLGATRDLSFQESNGGGFRPEVYEESLVKTFRNLGMSESAAKTAAQGRS
jgi:hypothetical protein